MNSAYPTKKVDFPAYAAHIKGLPKELHIRGQLPRNIAEKSLGIVGSRRISPYGVRVLREFFYYIKDTESVIISGFTAGTDTYAHEFAMDSGCSTVAVMPCGCDIAHPSSNKDLYAQILNAGGAVVSEFEDGFYPQKWTYPKRNRIIAALSRTLLVVEASLKSGSMITACFARSYGRKIFSVPGDIYTERSMGTNRLILEGAEIYLSACRLSDAAGLGMGEKSYHGGSTVPTNNKEERILEILKEKAQNYDNLSAKIGEDVRGLSVILSHMVMKNLIYEKGGTYYVL